MAQYFVREMFKDPIFKAFIPSGNEPILSFFEKAKDVKKILSKYATHVQELRRLIESNGLDTIFST
jgi:hypothetical protein